MGEGRAADITLAASSDRVWTDDVHRPTAGASEGRGDSTVRGLRRAPRAAKPQSSVDGRSGRRASRQRDFGPPCISMSYRQDVLCLHWACSEIRSRVLRSATVPFFYDKKNGTVALTLEHISEHAHCCYFGCLLYATFAKMN